LFWSSVAINCPKNYISVFGIYRDKSIVSQLMKGLLLLEIITSIALKKNFLFPLKFEDNYFLLEIITLLKFEGTIIFYAALNRCAKNTKICLFGEVVLLLS
jgi:hypothetical protein